MVNAIIRTINDGAFLFLLLMSLVGYIIVEFPYDDVDYFREIVSILGAR